MNLLGGTLGKLNLMTNWGPRDGGGGAVPPLLPPTGFFGLSTESDPANVDIDTLLGMNVEVGSITQITFNPLIAGQFIHLFIPTALEIDTLINLAVPPSGVDEASTYAKVEDVQTRDSVSLDGYTRGPISQAANGTSITYDISFVSGA